MRPGWVSLISLGASLLLVSAASAVGPEGVLDSRSWELVSPAEKNGGEVEAPGAAGAAALQAAAQGGAVAFGSNASFGPAAGAAPVNQYLSTGAAGGWGTVNLTPPLLSGTYGGGAYQLFSADLSRALLSSGWACRGAAPECDGENPPLGPGGPAGYRNLYLREGGQYEPLVTVANAPGLTLAAADFHLALAGATPDLGHAVVSTCAALTAAAIEAPGPDGCDPGAPNLYRWSAGALSAVNLLPGQGQTAPGASLAAPSGAISVDGACVYWKGADGNLYLREGGATVQVDEAAGGGGAFQAASANGAIAFFTKAGHLYRYDAVAETASDLTPSGGVVGVLAASASGAHLYFLDDSGLRHWSGGVTIKAANGADASNYPPATGAARVSADGTRLAFLSSASLTGYPNGGKSEVYLYDATAKGLRCVSCNPKGTAPAGPSSIPAARAAGEDGPLAYRPRSLSEDGARIFFTSADALVTSDSNGRPDAYQWQAPGTGGCSKSAGCLGLLSSGRQGEATFVDASADGADAYFLTSLSLLGSDPAAVDLYDARSGGGFPEPQPEIECEGDVCQGPPSSPDDPIPATAVVQGATNPPVRFAPRRCPKGKHRVRGRCVGKKQAEKRDRRPGGRR